MGDGSCQGIHVEHGMEDGLAPLLESARGGGNQQLFGALDRLRDF